MHAYRLVDTITYRATSFLLVELPELGGQYLLPARKVKRFETEGRAVIEIPEKILSQIKRGLRRLSLSHQALRAAREGMHGQRGYR